MPIGVASRLRRFSAPAALVALLLAAAPAARAGRMTYTFTATVTNSSNVDLSLGSTISGSFSYDPAMPEDVTVLMPANQSSYGVMTAGPGAVDPLGAEVALGPGFTYAPSAGASRSIAVLDNATTPASASPIDGVRFTFTEPDGATLKIFLEDSTASALSSRALPAALDLSKFNMPSLQYAKYLPPTIDASTGQPRVNAIGVTARLTSLTIQPVPEPSTLAVLAGGVVAGVVFRRRAARKALAAA